MLSMLGLASHRQVNALTQTARHDAKRAATEQKHAIQRLVRLEHKLDALVETIGGMDRILRRGRLRKVDDNVDALVRRTFLTWDLPHPQALLSRRFKGLSQNEEDGITVALLERIGVSTRRFVEIGAGVNGGNAGFLARECGWTGVMVESDPVRAQTLQRRFGQRVSVASTRVTRENVNDLLSEHAATGEIDLLSIDIDGIDFWVWDSLTVCQPRIVIAEFNPMFGADRAVTVPYDASFDRHRYKVPEMAYYGASLPALMRLGIRKGYRLVVVEPRGVNAFFVREDLAGDLPALPDDLLSYAFDGRAPIDTDALLTELQRAGLDLVDVE